MPTLKKTAKPKVPQMTEADLARYCHSKMTALKIFGWRVPLGGILRSRAGKIFHSPNLLRGFPDFAGVTKDGRLWALELKTPKGRITQEQISWQKKLLDHNAFVWVARTTQEIDRFFAEIAELNKA